MVGSPSIAAIIDGAVRRSWTFLPRCPALKVERRIPMDEPWNFVLPAEPTMALWDLLTASSRECLAKHESSCTPSNARRAPCGIGCTNSAKMRASRRTTWKSAAARGTSERATDVSHPLS
jgi:hypothetical protein